MSDNTANYNCAEWKRFGCRNEPFYKEFENERYCVLHYPGKEKSRDFSIEVESRMKAGNYNFCGARFPDELIIFAAATFKAHADFSHVEFTDNANFRNATFEMEANFYAAKFLAKANFDDATFKNRTTFESVTFKGSTNFHSATFDNGVNFHSANFQDRVVFDSATLKGEIGFGLATFSDYVSFAGTKEKPVFSDQSKLDLREAKIAKPELVSFRMLELRPHWFVYVDPRKFNFTRIQWRTGINDEIETLKKYKSIQIPHDLLVIACQQLATNYEENNHYEEASKFRYLAMDVRRQESWHGDLALWKLSWWYWLASGYGERVLRAFAILVCIWLLFAAAYTLVGFTRQISAQDKSNAPMATRDEVGEPLNFSRALLYSAEVMILQKPDPKPATGTARSLVILETILGPVQAALLALAIRRKFMR